jgi:hypothetical protein
VSNPAAVRRGPAIRSSMRSMSRTRFLMFGLFVSRAAIEPRFLTACHGTRAYHGGAPRGPAPFSIRSSWA